MRVGRSIVRGIILILGRRAPRSQWYKTRIDTLGNVVYVIAHTAKPLCFESAAFEHR